MKSIIVIEKKEIIGPAVRWTHFGTIQIEVPFANQRYNFVLEGTAALADTLAKLHAEDGTYRLGEDDDALIDWNGVSPRILTPVKRKTLATEYPEIAVALDITKIKN